MKIYCLMASGKPITEKVADILFYNAHDMLQDENEHQSIQGKGYYGYIKSNLQTIAFVGMCGVVFEAEIWTEENGNNKVKYLVRQSDLDGVEKAEWFGCAKPRLPKKKPVSIAKKQNHEWN